MEHENIVVSSEYTRAMKLNRHIKTHAQMAQESLYEVCKGLKEMRDGKLYQQLGYQNFEDYCVNEVGFNRNQAYKYISVAENLSSDFVSSRIQIGIQKLALLAKLDEPARQEVMQTVDVKSATVKDLNATIKKQEAKIKELEESSEKTKEEFETFRVDSKRRQDILMDKTKNLIEHVKELKKRPTEIAVQELNKAELEQLHTENEMLKKQLAEKPMIQEMLPGDSDMRAEFDAYLKTLNDVMKHLCTFVVHHENEYNMSSYISEITEKIETYTKLMRKEEETCQ